jgi:hypothetical protein
MAKTNVPFWYGIVDGNTVHLYVLVYATSANFSDDGSVVSIKKFKVISSGTNQSPQTKHFSFAIGTFDTIRISFNLNGSQTANKQVVIAIADLDQTSTSTPVLPLPEMDGDLALDVPYVFTHLIAETTNRFDAEMVVIPEEGRTFSLSKSGPDANKNTFSTLTYSSGSTTAYNPPAHEFTVTDVASDPYGDHTFEYKNGKRRRSRTKNNNHTQIPFPRPRRKL